MSKLDVLEFDIPLKNLKHPLLRKPFTANVVATLKGYVGKQEFHLLPKGLCCYILKLKVKVSGIAPDNTSTFIEKLIKKKAIVFLIYIEPEKIFRPLQISS